MYYIDVCLHDNDSTSITHVFRCPTGEENFVVHDIVQDIMAQLLASSLVQIRHEFIVDFPTSAFQCIRTLLTMAQDLPRSVDNMILADPLSQELVTWALAQTSVAALMERSMWSSHHASYLLPLAVEVFDHLYPQIVAGCSGAPLSILTTPFRQGISLTLQ